jgi:bacterioferritin
MKHADILAERILFLNGLPNFQAIHKLKVGETVEEILKADLAMEMEAIPLLKEAADYCQDVRDFTTGQIFEDILASEEEHVDFLETQFDMIARMGLENYVQLNSKPVGEGEAG